MSPILVRPVREQLEHDRVIRLLQAKLKKKHGAEANPGEERTAGFKIKGNVVFPDLILTTDAAGKRSQAIVEVETAESLNHLEVLAEWTHFSKAKAGFHLYVPASSVDVARRLMEQHDVSVTELWSYYLFGDQIRFLPIFRNKGPEPEPIKPEAKAKTVVKPPTPPKPEEKPEVKAKAPAAKAEAPKVAPKTPPKRGATTKTPTTKTPTTKTAAKKAAPRVAPRADTRVAKPAARAMRPPTRTTAKATSKKSAVKPSARPAKGAAKAAKPASKKRR